MEISRIAAMASKEWLEITRDRLFFSLAFIVPLMLMLIFRFGFSFDVRNIPLAVVDYDGTACSRDYAYRFISSRYFDFKGYAQGERQLGPLLAGGKVGVAIIIP
ncbi:MAG: ABC transporter permease, partial [Nitrospiraceae bacterium]|nr:ABC transporter permease [Nitrospiraceae bacterium]